ncbi:MAG: hypothetical protein HY804_00195 [Nitrospinae bacterium]|nr:hypothetical protein [Nitrospinota bacterium]
MSHSPRRAHSRAIRKEIVALLAQLYLFPQTVRALTAALGARFPGLEQDAARDALMYLEKKGYIRLAQGQGGRTTARVTPKGIDLADGAISDDAISPIRPGPAALALARQTRLLILAYCRRFPEAWNGDDEILAETSPILAGAVSLDQVRYHLWYLAGKGCLEMKTRAHLRDVVVMARITARGMDLLDGATEDPGVGDAIP